MKLLQKVTVAADVGETSTPEHLHLDAGRPLALPGAGEEGDTMTVLNTVARDLHAIALKSTERKVIEQNETQVHQ